MVTFSVAVSIDFCHPSLSVCGHSHAQWMSFSPKVSTQDSLELQNFKEDFSSLKLKI